MRILVTALGGPGHAFPLMPLATALEDAHEVTFGVGPGASDAVARSGLDVVVVGTRMVDAVMPVLRRRGLTAMPAALPEMLDVAREAFRDVMPRSTYAGYAPWIAEHRPDLVIAEVADAGAALAAAAAGVPCVLHSYGRRIGTISPTHELVDEPLAAVAAELGIAVTVGDPLGHAHLDICPPSLQSAPDGPTVPDIPLRPTAWNPPMPSFVAPRTGQRPWVYLTLGTAIGDVQVLRRAAEGLARLDVEVLIASGSIDAAEVDDLVHLGGPGRVRVEPFVPQAELFVRDPPALAVHHGGSGTTLASAAAAVPQLLMPYGADQFFNAEALCGTGAGRTLGEPDAVTADAVERAAAALLSDAAVRVAADTLAAEIAEMPGPGDVAARVEEWARP